MEQHTILRKPIPTPRPSLSLLFNTQYRIRLVIDIALTNIFIINKKKIHLQAALIKAAFFFKGDSLFTGNGYFILQKGKLNQVETSVVSYFFSVRSTAISAGQVLQQPPMSLAPAAYQVCASFI